MTADIGALLHETDAVGLAALVRTGDVGASELLEAAITRARALDPALNFMAQWCPDRARTQAAGPLPAGPLAGVPFLVKDLGVQVAGVPTGSGSRFLAHTPDFNATFVDRADAAGLMIFGKTTTPELGLTVTTESRAHGQTRNPWNRGKTSGGSSGGAAAAVAAGVVPLAQASDGGGSVRVPASCCGLFGLKTSRGLVPLGPDHVESWNGLSGIGPISRSVRDAAAFLDVFAGPAAGCRVRPARPAGGYLAAITRRPGPLRIAAALQPWTGGAVDPDVAETFDATIALLQRLGHRVHNARPAIDMGALSDAGVANVAVATGRTIGDQERLLGAGPAPDGLESLTAMWRHLCDVQSGLALQDALHAYQMAAVAIDRFFEGTDLFLTPTLATPPVDLGVLALSNPDAGAFGRAFNAFCPYASLANMTGTPAMSLPLGTSRDGLPIGMMVQGRFGEDALLLQLAAEIEQEAPWAQRRPAPYARAD